MRGDVYFQVIQVIRKLLPHFLMVVEFLIILVIVCNRPRSRSADATEIR